MNSFVKESFPNTPKDQLKILDAGAGTGPIGIELDKLGYTDIHALDISEEMLNVARQKGVPYKRFICTALTEKRVCEVETGEFDIVIAAGALIMANVRPEALVEIVRMVKKGELVFLSLSEGELDLRRRAFRILRFRCDKNVSNAPPHILLRISKAYLPPEGSGKGTRVTSVCKV